MRYIAFFNIVLIVSGFVNPTFTNRKSFRTLERRYDNDSQHFLTIKCLRLRFGEKKRWAGMRDTRCIYHKLLPRYADDYIGNYSDKLETLAKMTSESRLAAKIFAREQSKLYVQILSILYDVIRHGSTTGLTFEKLWKKYEKQVKRENPFADENEIRYRTSLRILEKSCKTNRSIDIIVL